MRDVDASGGVEHVPAGHGLVALAFFGEHLGGGPVPFHGGQGFPAVPPVVEDLACLVLWDARLVELAEIGLADAHDLHVTGGVRRSQKRAAR